LHTERNIIYISMLFKSKVRGRVLPKIAHLLKTYPEIYLDYTISSLSSGCSFKANRSILSASLGSCVDNLCNTLKHQPSAIVQAMLDFVHFGRCEIEEASSTSLLFHLQELARNLELTELQGLCGKGLKKQKKMSKIVIETDDYVGFENRLLSKLFADQQGLCLSSRSDVVSANGVYFHKIVLASQCGRFADYQHDSDSDSNNDPLDHYTIVSPSPTFVKDFAQVPVYRQTVLR